MSNKHAVPPMQRRTLLAMLADPAQHLTRVPGGYYCPASQPHPVFTGRTIKAMERDGLIKLDAPFCTSRVDFTDEGKAIAIQLQESDQAQAGAA